MTLPPINPASIRREPSIDAAAPFRQWEEMPEDLAMDGLHGDWRAKEMMARVINEELPRLAPDLRTF